MTIIRLLFLTALLVFAGNVAASGYDVKDGCICFNFISKNECEIAKVEDVETIEIPSKIVHNNKKYSVTRIGDGAFYDCSSLSDLTIPETVSSIGDYAFHGCMMLKSTTIPENVTRIGEGTFSYCVSLQEITIPEGVVTIGKDAFAYCCSLRSVHMPGSVRSIGQGAFDDCTSLESITFPEGGVNNMEGMAFPWCVSLKEVTIPNGITAIGDATFFGCTSLEQITIPESVESIGVLSFSECQNVKQIISTAAVPPSLGTEQCQAFSEKLYPITKVVVPTNSLEAYRRAREWKDFKNLVGGAENSLSIEGIAVDNDANGKTRMYDIQGNQLKNKSRGINIIKTPGEKAHKTIVR